MIQKHIGKCLKSFFVSVFFFAYSSAASVQVMADLYDDRPVPQTDYKTAIVQEETGAEESIPETLTAGQDETVPLQEDAAETANTEQLSAVQEVMEDATKYAYMPVHVAILMDASGSIASPTEPNPSDKELYSRDLAKAIAQNLPVDGQNMVSLFEYSSDCRQIAPLTSIESQENIRFLNEKLSSMTDCYGSTNMVDAITQVRTYLEEHSSEDARNVIIVFTDGAESSAVHEDSPPEVIQQVVSNAVGDSDVSVYSVAFDYLDDNNVHSVSGNSSYGKRLLQEFADQTGGQVLIAEKDICELNSLFTQVVDSLCFRKSTPVSVSNGLFHVNSSVVEVNIRIFSNIAEIVQNGTMVLHTPSGEEITFTDTQASSPEVWYYADRLATNIKIMNPESGDWSLEVSGVDKNAIEINMMEQYNISLETQISHPKEKISKHDPITIETRLLSDGTLVSDESMYQNSDVRAVCFTSPDLLLPFDIRTIDPQSVEGLLNEKGIHTIPMQKEKDCFRMTQTMENSGRQLLGIWVYSPRYYCYSSYYVVVDKDSVKITSFMKTQDLTNGEAKTVSSLEKYCSQEDAAVSIHSVDENMLQAVLDADSNTLTLTPLQPGNTKFFLHYAASDGESDTEMPVNVNIISSTPVFDVQAVSRVLDNSGMATKNAEEVQIYEEASGEIPDLSAMVSDLENDTLHFVIDDISDGGIVNASIEGDTLKLTGFYNGEVDVRIGVTDGTTYEYQTLHVVVTKSPLAKLIIAGLICIALIGSIIVAIVIRKGKRQVKLTMRDVKLRFNDLEEIQLCYQYDTKSNFRNTETVTMDRILCLLVDNADLRAKDIQDIKDRNSALIDILIGCMKGFTLIGAPTEKGADKLEGMNSHIRVNNSPLGSKYRTKIGRKTKIKTITFCYDNQVPGQEGFPVGKVELVFTCGGKQSSTPAAKTTDDTPFGNAPSDTDISPF